MTQIAVRSRCRISEGCVTYDRRESLTFNGVPGNLQEPLRPPRKQPLSPHSRPGSRTRQQTSRLELAYYKADKAIRNIVDLLDDA
jgi:hypothetical protein